MQKKETLVQRICCGNFEGNLFIPKIFRFLGSHSKIQGKNLQVFVVATHRG